MADDTPPGLHLLQEDQRQPQAQEQPERPGLSNTNTTSLAETTPAAAAAADVRSSDAPPPIPPPQPLTASSEQHETSSREGRLSPLKTTSCPDQPASTSAPELPHDGTRALEPQGESNDLSALVAELARRTPPPPTQHQGVAATDPAVPSISASSAPLPSSEAAPDSVLKVETPLNPEILIDESLASASTSTDSVVTNGHDPSSSLPEQQTNGADMSNPPHSHGASRQTPNYGMPPYAAHTVNNQSYGYPGAAGQVGVGTYPASSSSDSGPMALPSMRTLESVQQQQQHPPPQPTQHQHAHQSQHMQIPSSAMSSSISTVPSTMGYYQSPPPLGSNSHYGLPSDISGQHWRLPGANQHKKEIKRRTKTGCMTCRKRRIKCDEAHPVCKNCQKSKRECLGYDPIFKQQQQHPTNIQPAPNSAPSPTVGHQPLTSGVTTPAQYSHLSPVLSSSAASSHASASPHALSEYAGALDPTAHSAIATPTRKMRVEELVAMGGALPQAPNVQVTEEREKEIQDCFDVVYAPGLESFFETKWYTKKTQEHIKSQGGVINGGGDALATSPSMVQTMISFLQSLAYEDEAGMQYSANLEFRVVWETAELAKMAGNVVGVANGPPPPNGSAHNDLPPVDDGTEAKNRLAVFDALLSGEFLDREISQGGKDNRLLLKNPDHMQGDYQRLREFRFWYALGSFLLVKDEPGLDKTAEREQHLNVMRNLLDGRENRDVLYSFAVIRTYSPMFPSDFENAIPSHLDESDPKCKLAVARNFIASEARVDGGTTNVVRRFSELALRAFVAPGNNISRR